MQAPNTRISSVRSASFGQSKGPSRLPAAGGELFTSRGHGVSWLWTPALQMCSAGFIKGYPQQADLLQLTPVDDEKTSPAVQHTSGDGDPDTEQPLRVMVLQSTALCCTPHPGVKTNLLLQNICFTEDELYQVLKGANFKTGSVRVQMCHMADLVHCGFGFF